ncbi:MAG TPA: AAA family ATPase, partial [Candidatus Dormibacteraeota bacterium]|nr:AAA family ATPase [Candidatus Dormibacteraeota bacterium]
MAEVVGRPVELEAIERMLGSLADGPAGVVLEGEPGIGKTTLWQAGVEEARRRGMRVLLCRAVEVEAQMSYASLADLLSGIDDELVRDLPDPQRRALQVALLRAGPEATPPDQRAIATGVLTLLGRMARETPVLVAIDDLQWLDRSSALVVGFVARRLSGPVGLLVALRTQEGRAGDDLLFPDPGRLQRLRLGPLSMGALHRLIADRTGQAIRRPALAHVQDLSGGNPFFALEIARTLGAGPSARLPATLVEVVRVRLDGLDPHLQDVLLATATVAKPTVEGIRAVVGGDAPGLLERAEELELVEIHAGRVRFTHPLLASGIYAAASPAQQRAMHRRLANVVPDDEERARHLALAAMQEDAETIGALDHAAVQARARGAPAAAAELLELAIDLGADEPERMVQAAEHHFDAGDPARARALLEAVVPSQEPGPARAGALGLLAMIRCHADSYLEGARLFEEALAEAGDDLRLVLRLTLGLLYAQCSIGHVNEARQRTDAMVAVAERIGEPGLLAQALAISVLLRFMVGEGIDEAGLERALRLEDPDMRTNVIFRPSLAAGQLMMWSGRLEEARALLLAMRQHCLDRGEESDLMYVLLHATPLECWRGDLTSAQQLADDAIERALQLGTEVARAQALSVQAWVAAFAGRQAEARWAADEALQAWTRGEAELWVAWAIVALGFLELSVGEEEAAADRLLALVEAMGAMGLAEPMQRPQLPDAAEALIAVGRLDEAAALVDELEESGRRLDRAWARAVGARCRMLLLAARGELDAALELSDRALAEFERLPMPIERARTLLVVGQLQRRSNRRLAARASLEEAQRVFQEVGVPIWAARAGHELERL